MADRVFGRASAERLLAKCRSAGVRVVLLDGLIRAGFPQGDAGVFSWAPPPRKLAEEIRRHEAAIRAVLDDSGSARPWSVEQVDGGALLVFAHFGAQARTRRPRAPAGDAA